MINKNEGRAKKYGLRSLHPTNFQHAELIKRIENTIEIKDFSFSYGRSFDTLNLKKIFVQKGDVVAILGNNGAGKTTFAKCLCGLEKRVKAACCYWKCNRLSSKC